MILKVQGKKFYSLAIPAHGENTLMVDKGNYRLKSSICDLPYISEKNVNKSLLITLNNPSPVKFN